MLYLLEKAINIINQTVNDGVAHSKNPRKCAYHMTFDLDLEHTLDAGLPGDHLVQVWWRSGHVPGRISDFCVGYHVTFDLDLEHTLDARWPGVDLVKVWWRPGHLCARRSDLRKSLQTDGRTHRRRTPRHCISSFLERANNYNNYSVLGIVGLGWNW